MRKNTRIAWQMAGIFRMSLIGAAVGGIELCYSAETAFVSPLLLQLGVPVYLMTLCWMASPVLGFLLVPILGSASDTCTSPLGRRRPSIIFYSTGIVMGLLLVPYGRNIGELLGDKYIMTVTTLGNSTNATVGNYTSNEVLTSDASADNNHPAGIIFTILGVILLDFCCDGCQTPCRTLMIDLTSLEDQSQGLATLTVIAGLGGTVGYAVGGINWSKHLQHFQLDPEFSTHVHVVFGVVLAIFCIGCLLTLFSAKENAIGKENQKHEYKRMYNCENSIPSTDDDVKITNISSSKSANSLLRSTFNLPADELTDEQHISRSKSLNAACSEEVLVDANGEACSASITDRKLNNNPKPVYNSLDGQSYVSDWSSITDEDVQLSEPEMKTFLKSIIFMPKHMWILCLCNLFCWMSLVTYSLYFTDYVGQSIYRGVPVSSTGSIERVAYNDGVRMGSLAMSLYSLSCTVYSLAIVKLIDRFGTKIVYVTGQLVYSVGMALLAATGHIVTAFIGSLAAGFMYATLFTMPYILVSRYHNSTEFSKLHMGNGNTKLRGLGTDIAIVSSMVFAGQFILSLFIGVLIHVTGSTVVIPVTASVLSLCGAVTALKVEYVGA